MTCSIHRDAQMYNMLYCLFQATTFPACFISYCWGNSQRAVDKGTRSTPGAVGWGDPRQVKEYLEEKGVPCWMDTEQVGKVIFSFFIYIYVAAQLPILAHLKMGLAQLTIGSWVAHLKMGLAQLTMTLSPS